MTMDASGQIDTPIAGDKSSQELLEVMNSSRVSLDVRNSAMRKLITRLVVAHHEGKNRHGKYFLG